MAIGCVVEIPPPRYEVFPRYVIVRAGPEPIFWCLVCDHRSRRPDDVATAYCGTCGVFQNEVQAVHDKLDAQIAETEAELARREAWNAEHSAGEPDDALRETLAWAKRERAAFRRRRGRIG